MTEQPTAQAQATSDVFAAETAGNVMQSGSVDDTEHAPRSGSAAHESVATPAAIGDRLDEFRHRPVLSWCG